VCGCGSFCGVGSWRVGAGASPAPTGGGGEHMGLLHASGGEHMGSPLRVRVVVVRQAHYDIVVFPPAVRGATKLLPRWGNDVGFIFAAAIRRLYVDGAKCMGSGDFSISLILRCIAK
jgi:hypothetical protein